jgi:ferrous iron transport protein B
LSNTKLNIALVGNPNCGKTSLFNVLTGLNQKVGNFPGVTVDQKVGSTNLPHGITASIIDLPGTYSLSPQSPDEKVVQDILLNPAHKNFPDVVVIVLDATNLKRNLFLATQILELGFKTIVAINVIDLAEKEGIHINTNRLQEFLKCPVVHINAKDGVGINELKTALSQEIPIATFTANTLTPEHTTYFNDIAQRFLDSASQKFSFKILSNLSTIDWLENKADIEQEMASKLLEISQLRITEITNRYKLVADIFNQSVSLQRKENTNMFSSKADKIFTHKVWGVLIFLLVFFLIFQSVFTLAAYPMDWIDGGIGQLNEWLKTRLPNNMFSSFIIDGLIAGLGGILVFIPQIMILFGLINILEETGYMARVSFINDRILRSVGMNGRSVVPLVGGFACAVPSIMAARTIENLKERLITILITPMMSCSARLPVYVFLIAFIVPDDFIFGFISLQGLFMLGLYLLGIAVSVLVAFVLNKIIKTTMASSFIMEMPNYRMPRWNNVIYTMFNKGQTFVTEAGKIILMVSIVLWFLASFGPGDAFDTIEAKYQTEAFAANHTQDELSLLEAQEKLQNSYAGQLGKVIEPVIRPLGFDWKIGIALISSFAAREVFVGSMSTIYSVGGGENNIAGLQNKLMNEIDPKTGQPIMTMPIAFSLLIFYVFAMQCMSTLAIIKRETNSWKWPLIAFGYLTAIAYLGSFITYQSLK